MKPNLHTPLFLEEITALLKERQAESVIDATFATGGHGLTFAENGIRVLGIEWDSGMYKLGTDRARETGLANRVTLVNANFATIGDIARAHGFVGADAVLFDLGISMQHIREAGRGFTYEKDEPLDLRISTRLKARGEDVINTLAPDMLYEIMTKFVEDRHTFRLVDSILKERTVAKIRTVGDLRRVIEGLGIPDTEAKNLLRKTLQGLRMIVNDELENIRQGLEGACSVLKDKGLLFVITFHSQEDRVVKMTMRALAERGVRRLGKPIVNKKEKFARGAKMRIYEK